MAEKSYGITGDDLTPCISWSLYSLRKDWDAARVLSVSVRFERGRWFASFAVEAEVRHPAPRLPDAVAGVDLGIKRQGPDRRVGRKPSNRWRRASAALGMAHGRVADQRKDGLHKLTTRLTSEFGTVVVEDLHAAGMVRNRRLARHVADASFGEFRRQAEYKAAWRGGRVIIADRWFASSKTCSGCGAVKAKLPLSDRAYAIANGRGADRKTGAARQVAVKRQPGTAPAGQTGTVPAQAGTAA